MLLKKAYSAGAPVRWLLAVNVLPKAALWDGFFSDLSFTRWKCISVRSFNFSNRDEILENAILSRNAKGLVVWGAGREAVSLFQGRIC